MPSSALFSCSASVVASVFGLRLLFSGAFSDLFFGFYLSSFWSLFFFFGFFRGDPFLGVCRLGCFFFSFALLSFAGRRLSRLASAYFLFQTRGRVPSGVAGARDRLRYGCYRWAR
jgi:hypothetical protein